MAAQKPVIACNCRVPVETTKGGVTGFLYNRTPLEFLQAMSRLVTDPEMAARMGKEAWKQVKQKFSTKTVGEQLNHYVLDAFHQRKSEQEFEYHLEMEPSMI